MVGLGLILPLAPLISGENLWLLWTLALTSALISNPFWMLIHESIHGLMFQNRPLNEWAGRIMGVVIGSPLGILRAGHLLHHKYSRSELDRTEVIPAAESGGPGFALNYYSWILGGLYFTEVMGGLVALLPPRWIRALAHRAERGAGLGHQIVDMLLQSRKMKIIRLDALLALTLFLFAVWLYGQHWYVLGTALVLRGFLISMLDNVYHYGTALDNPLDALNLTASTTTRLFLLNATYHGVHHRFPRIPWYELPACCSQNRERGIQWQTRPLWKQWLRQLEGPIPESSLPRALPGRRDLVRP